MYSWAYLTVTPNLFCKFCATVLQPSSAVQKFRGTFFKLSLSKTFSLAFFVATFRIFILYQAGTNCRNAAYTLTRGRREFNFCRGAAQSACLPLSCRFSLSARESRCVVFRIQLYFRKESKREASFEKAVSNEPKQIPFY